MKLNWNLERWRTRDRLLEYDTSIVPPHPIAAGGLVSALYPWDAQYVTMVNGYLVPQNTDSAEIKIIYPWENTSLSILFNQLYLIAVQNGFIGDVNDFKKLFVNYVGEKQILFADYDEFPAAGMTDKFYFDQVEKILYYWDGEYIPVNAMLIANTMLDGGEA